MLSKFRRYARKKTAEAPTQVQVSIEVDAHHLAPPGPNHRIHGLKFAAGPDIHDAHLHFRPPARRFKDRHKVHFALQDVVVALLLRNRFDLRTGRPDTDPGARERK